MKFLTQFCLLPIFLCLCINSLYSLEQADRTAIEEIIQNYADAWNLQQGKGFGDGFTEDADFVNIFGMHFSGKAEIEDRHIKILQGFLKDSKLKITDINLREINPNVVVALVRWNLDGFRNPKSDLKALGEVRSGIFTQVFISQQNKWEITASQNTLSLN